MNNICNSRHWKALNQLGAVIKFWQFFRGFLKIFTLSESVPPKPGHSLGNGVYRGCSVKQVKLNGDFRNCWVAIARWSRLEGYNRAPWYGGAVYHCTNGTLYHCTIAWLNHGRSLGVSYTSGARVEWWMDSQWAEAPSKCILATLSLRDGEELRCCDWAKYSQVAEEMKATLKTKNICLVALRSGIWISWDLSQTLSPNPRSRF